MHARRPHVLALLCVFLGALLGACASSRFPAVPGREGETLSGARVAPGDELLFVERDDARAEARAELARTLGLPAGSELPEIGALVVHARGEGFARVVLPASTRVDAEVAGASAIVRVRQRFEPADTVERALDDAAYVLPLARGAAVHDFTMRIGARTIRGVVRERGEAERLYAAAIASGRRAALLTAERAGVFLQRIVRAEAVAAIDVDVRYAADVAWDGAWRVLALPASSPAGAGALEAAIELDAGAAIASVALGAEGARVEELAPERRSVRVVARPGSLERPLVVRWRLASAGVLAGSVVARGDAERAWIELALDPVGGAALDDVRVDWDGLVVDEREPETIGAVAAGRPARLVASLRAGASSASVRVRARVADRDVELVLPVRLVRAGAEPLALAWARSRVARLDRDARANGAGADGARAELLRVALEHGLATPLTSLVAVDALAPTTPIDRGEPPNASGAAGRTTP